jgi:DNA-binding transcriptional LysR family regulator
MKTNDLDDLALFMAVADERSFTRAAARLGLSQSALSHAVKALEERLGLRLLARTTRSVATTEAGERLLRRLRPALGDIDSALQDLRELRARPSGTVRITTMKHAYDKVIRPALVGFLRDHPDVSVEIDVDEGLTDIVASRFDAGIRHGEAVDRDMIAVRICPDLRFAVVASPGYVRAHGKPRTPKELVAHRCINYRFKTSRTLAPWEFERDGRELKVRVDGPLVVNDAELMLSAALDGHGFGFVYEDQVVEHLAKGRLVRVLSKWCPPIPGYYLYYPDRRQTPALAALIEVLRLNASRRPRSA